MKALERILIFIMAIAIIATITLGITMVYYNNTKKNECNTLGGIYIDNQCIKAKLIPMED